MAAPVCSARVMPRRPSPPARGVGWCVEALPPVAARPSRVERLRGGRLGAVGRSPPRNGGNAQGNPTQQPRRG